MYESSKTRAVRGDEFAEKFLAGSVLDIGSGHDLVVPHAQPFDLEHGDANRILDHVEPASFDTVHSSHCLEHMQDPPQAIRDWWQLVKPGGYLIVVVPHEDLYEQGNWPSIFNSDHKVTFRLRTERTWSPVSHDLYELARSLPDAEIISAELQDHAYRRELLKHGPETAEMEAVRYLQMQLVRRFLDKQLATLFLLDELNDFFAGLGACVDQTLGSALAQIQLIVRRQT